MLYFVKEQNKVKIKSTVDSEQCYGKMKRPVKLKGQRQGHSLIFPLKDRRVHRTVGQLVKALEGNPDDLSSMSTPHMVEAKNQPLKCPLASSRAPPQHNKKYF